MIVPCTTPAPSSVFRLGGEASAAYVHIAYAVNISFGYPTGTVFTNIVDASAAVGPMNLIAEQYVLYALGVATNGTHITAAVATASAFLAHANSVSELCVILGFYDGRAQLNLPPPLPYPTPDGTTLAANSSNIWSSPVAYPATGSPGAVAPANRGKLGTSYPDGTTILITADGELSSPGGTTTTTITSGTTTKAMSLWNGSGNNPPPANWQTNGYDDSAWAYAVVVPENVFSPGDGISGASLIDCVGRSTAGSEQVIFRKGIGLPPGTIISATLQIACDTTFDDVYVSGNAQTFTAFSNGTIQTIHVPVGNLSAGATNILALRVADDAAAGGGNVAFRLDVVTTTTGGVIEHNGTIIDAQPILDFEDPAFTVTDDAVNSRVQVTLKTFVASGASHAAGIVPDPGSSAGSTKFLREDATWGVPAGSGLSNPMTAVGDLIVGSTVTAGVAAPARVGIGSAGQVLTVSGGTPVWGAAGGGSGGALTQIAQVLLGADTANFDFTSIPGTYSTLWIILQVRGTTAATNINALVTLNNDSGSNYGYQYVYGNVGAAGAGSNTSTTSILVPFIDAASATAGAASPMQLLLPNYAATTFWKPLLGSSFAILPSTAWAGGYWKSTSAVTRITIAPASGNWKTGSIATLYGVS